MNNIVIIGAGQAAAWAAHTLRQQGFTGRLSIVSNEERVFCRKALCGVLAIVCGDLIVPPEIAAFLHLDVVSAALHDEHLLDRAGFAV